MEEVIEKSLSPLEHKKQLVAQKKARLQKYEAMIKIQERKAQLSRHIRIGELAEKAGIHTWDHTTLLGAFMSIAHQKVDRKTHELWTKEGQRFMDFSKVKK